VECCLVAGWIVDPSRDGLNLERVIRFNDSLNEVMLVLENFCYVYPSHMLIE
jgi:hypothetical protein